MGISHSWNGTVLTITSDSGTSSADLKGDIGIRGPQGATGEQYKPVLGEDYLREDEMAQLSEDIKNSIEDELLGHKHTARDITDGVLPFERGGTGASQTFVDAPKNAVVRKAADGSNQLYYTATNDGAFFATGEDAAPKFATLPIAQGGTGATTPEEALIKLGAKAPSLSASQKEQLQALARAYTSSASSGGYRANFYYNGNKIRNSYLSPDAFYDANRVNVNCSLLCGLIWGGVKPETFTKFLNNQSAFNGTLDKAFDWGYQFIYANRKAYGLQNSDGLAYGLLKVGDDYTGATGYGSYYDPTSTRTDKQWFYSYATAADTAWELYANGYEIPIKDIEVGDLLFYHARGLSDGLDDYKEAIRFRNITHVAMVTEVAVVNGQKQWSVAESTSMMGEAYPVIELKYTSTSAGTIARLAYLNNKICMVARHPAAFGVASNLGDKYAEI